jgi:hypothetical protein
MYSTILAQSRIRTLSALPLTLFFTAHLSFFAAHLSAAQINSYHIGNSLMNDGLGNGGDGNRAIERVVWSYGYDYNASYHIDSSQTLQTIWNTPSGAGGDGVNVVEESYGKFDHALLNYHWDHVLLEPFYVSSTLGSDKQMISNFINYTRQNPANQDTVFYIYQIWPRQTHPTYGGEYSSYWAGSSPNVDTTPIRARREFYANLMQWAHETYTQNGITVREVPVGEVLNRLSLMIQSGELTGITMADFYRDDTHASLTLGRYIAVVTQFATMFKQSPIGLIPPSTHFPDPTLTPALADTFNRVIWDVVSSDYYTGIADFNNDGYVGNLDLTIWSNAYGLTDAGDADGDGDTDGRDFLYWQRNFRAEPAGLLAEARIVPEPSSFFLSSGILVLGLMLRRRAA